LSPAFIHDLCAGQYPDRLNLLKSKKRSNAIIFGDFNGSQTVIFSHSFPA